MFSMCHNSAAASRILSVQVDHEVLELREDLSYQEYPTRILDQSERRTRQKSIKFLKVQWSNHSEDEATWEREESSS